MAGGSLALPDEVTAFPSDGEQEICLISRDCSMIPGSDGGLWGTSGNVWKGVGGVVGMSMMWKFVCGYEKNVEVD